MPGGVPCAPRPIVLEGPVPPNRSADGQSMAKDEWDIPEHLQPDPTDYAFDLDTALGSVVGLRTAVAPDAFTAGVLGTAICFFFFFPLIYPFSPSCFPSDAFLPSIFPFLPLFFSLSIFLV